MAGSADIRGRQNYILGIGHPKNEAPAEGAPAVFSEDGQSLQGIDGLASFPLITQSDVAVPASNLTAAAGSAGALTGAYYYATAFLLSDGTVTAPWTGTATAVNVTSQRIELSNIPVSPSPKVAGRVLLRTTATPIDPKAYYVLATINDNTSTTYSDNAIDGALTVPANWIGNAGQMNSDGSRVVGGLSEQSQSLAIGNGSSAGYASVHIGLDAGKDTTIGRRNTSVGVYSLENVTSGYQNTSIGTHAGGGITVSYANTMLGYAAGGAVSNMGFGNTAVGDSSLGGNPTKGDGNTALGYRTLLDMGAGLGYCIAIGYAAGKYADNNRQVFIDGADRGNIANCRDVGLIYGRHEPTAIAQRLHLNALTRVGPPSLTVASLPAAAGLTGFRAFVTDANATTFASVVAGGGANGVPVYCDGTNWRIG